MYKASVTKYNRVSLPSWEDSIKRSTYQGNATKEAANWLFGNLQRPQRVFGSLLRDFTGHTWWFRRGRGTRNSICFPMCLYRSLLSHQSQSRLSQWKPYGNTLSQTQQRRMTYPLTVWFVATSQRDRVGLGVGGKMFVTSRITLMNYPKTLLFKLVDIRDSLIVYFVDRDPEFFFIILHFYRVGVRNVPTYPTIHRKLQIEVDFYELNSLADITYNCRNICGNCKEYIYCIVIYNV